ncbi:diacylglycerol kinase [Streptomyces fragilis]|uniref:Diacylglycerol kinase n=1 Tax=Streptomyces fragilis TaxID=67301 RepID=A0ABV2YQZ7_9ACTN|nr:diacylglycerol kinase [Streptomyces fragilis]
MTEVASEQLLVVVDPSARRTDGESVRIAKDVLCAGARVKWCLPEGREEFARALERRGSRRPVVVGDDHALLRAVTVLERHGELDGCALAVVPVVGRPGALTVALSLGVPQGTVAAARAVLDGSVRRLDLLADDAGGLVLGELRIPAVDAAPHRGLRPARRRYRSLVSALARQSRAAAEAAGAAGPGPSRLRVETDGATLVDLDQPVRAVTVTPGRTGRADVEVRPVSVGAEAAPLQAAARTVTVSGADFRYRADATVAGPVRTRTWTVRAGAWGLVLPG